MPVLRQAGGPSGRGAFRFNWQGATVLRQIDEATEQALEAEAQEVRADLFASLHKLSGDNARSSFAEVGIRGGKRALVLGADMPYTVYEEFRHPIIRSVADRHAGHITQRLRAALGGR